MSSTLRFLRSGIAVFGLLMLALLSLLRPALAVEAQRVPLERRRKLKQRPMRTLAVSERVVTQTLH